MALNVIVSIQQNEEITCCYLDVGCHWFYGGHSGSEQ